jgi:hypothetical protein
MNELCNPYSDLPFCAWDVVVDTSFSKRIRAVYLCYIATGRICK